MAIPRFVRTLGTAAGVHYGALIICAVVLLIASSRSWFFFDDFAFLVPSLDGGLWAPHVGHWSTVPFVIFHALRQVFGIDHFLPFAVPVILAHLGVAHLIWRISIRAGADARVATALGLLMTFLGAGGENILWAFQVGFVGAIALSLWVILIFTGPRLTIPRGVGAAVLAILALASSGTALPLLAVAGVVGWRRHGFVRAAAVLVVPAIAYLTWYVLAGGGTQPSAGQPVGFAAIVVSVPTFALAMLTDGIGRGLPVAILGPIAFLVLAGWWLVRLRSVPRQAEPVFILFLAAPVFALLTGFSRAGLGIETATSSRYLYFIFAVMIPLAALAISALVVARAHLAVPALLAIGVIVLYNAGGLAATIALRMDRAEAAHERISAAADRLDDVGPAEEGLRPASADGPDVRFADVAVLVRNGWFHPGEFDAAADLTIRSLLDVAVEEADGPPADLDDCELIVPGEVPTTIDSETVLARSDASGIWLRLSDGDAEGDPLFVPVSQEWTTISISGHDGTGMVFQAGDREYLVCSS